MCYLTRVINIKRVRTFIKINLNFNHSIAILASLSLLRFINWSRPITYISAAITREIRQISRRVIVCCFSTDIQSRSLTRLTCTRQNVSPLQILFKRPHPYAFPMSPSIERWNKRARNGSQDLSRTLHGRTNFKSRQIFAIETSTESCSTKIVTKSQE